VPNGWKSVNKEDVRGEGLKAADIAPAGHTRVEGKRKDTSTNIWYIERNSHMPHGIRSCTMSTYISIPSPQSVPHLHMHLIANHDARGCIMWSSWNHSTDLACSRKQCMSSTYLDSSDYMVAGVEGLNFDDTSFRQHPLRNTGYVRLCLDQRMHEMVTLPTYCRACGDDLALLECIRLFTDISPGSHLEKKKHT